MYVSKVEVRPLALRPEATINFQLDEDTKFKNVKAMSVLFGLLGSRVRLYCKQRKQSFVSQVTIGLPETVVKYEAEATLQNNVT